MTLSPRPPPAASSKPTLVNQSPTASAPANIRIGHVQLRDLVICPAERGVLWYIADKQIFEQDLFSKRPDRQHPLATLSFTPVTLSALKLHSNSSTRRRNRRKELILLAAGGQDAELYLALYQYTPRRTNPGKENVSYGDLSEDTQTDNDDEDYERTFISERTTMIWQHMSSLVGSINNNVLLYMPPPALDKAATDVNMDLTISALELEDAIKPRLVVSNNDCTVKFFDVSLARRGIRSERSLGSPVRHTVDSRFWRRDFGRGREGEGWGSQRIVRYERVGCLRLDVPVNHTSISPDGSTVLACGDASTIFLYRILPKTDGNMLIFEPLANYTIPVPSSPPRPSLQGTIRPMRTSGPGNAEEGIVPTEAPPSAYLPYAFVGGGWVVAGSHSYYAGLAGADSPPACFATAWSADGTRFAAAGQEGAVRVWDVRSQNPLQSAQFETVPDIREGNEEMLNLVGMWYDHPGAAPPWGIRALKFARNASGREVLVFTEHVSRFHVVDADTFSVHDVVRVPHVNLPSQSSRSSINAPIAMQPSSPSHHDPYRLSTLPLVESTDIVFGSAVPQRPPRSNVLRPRDIPMLPQRDLEQAASLTRMWENDGIPFVRSPEALNDDDPFLPRERPRIVHTRERHPMRHTVGEDSSDPPSSVLIRRMARQYQRALDEVTPTPLPNPSPAQEEDMRARARTALRLLREMDDADREGRSSGAAGVGVPFSTTGVSQRDDSTSGSSSGQGNMDASAYSANLSSRSILHSLMMRNMRMPSEETVAGPSEPSSSSSSSLPTFTRSLPRTNRILPPSRVSPSTFQTESHYINSHSPPEPEDGGPLSFVARGRRTQIASAREDDDMDEDSGDGDGDGDARSSFFGARSPPPPVSAGVLSQSSFAGSESPIERDPSWSENGSGSTLPGLLSTSSSEVGDSDGEGEGDTDGSWTGISGGSVSSQRSRNANTSSSWMLPSPGHIISSLIQSESDSPFEVPAPTSVVSSEPRLPQASESSLSANPHIATITSSSEMLPSCQSLIERIEPLDIAGVCFDPTGAYMYVATTDGLTEWAIKGANSQRWWSSSGYI